MKSKFKQKPAIVKIKSVYGANKSTRKRAPRMVPTAVGLGTFVSVSWACPGGLPDVHDRQRAFCTHGRGKNVVYECRGE